MPYSAPLEMLADASGSVSFGWADDGVYYARFGRSLSARLGEAFAARLAEVAASADRLKYFGDARSVDSYDLVARRAFIRAVRAQRHKFAELNLLWWDGDDMGESCVKALGEPLFVTRDAVSFESRLLVAAPRAKSKLLSPPASSLRARWPLRR
jgi:hypothetical protein